MASTSSTTKTLIALADFHLWSQIPAVRDKQDRALLRWVDGADGRPMLTPILNSWLTPCDRIGLLFGSRELFLEKICEIAHAVLSSVHDVSLSHSCICAIQRTVAHLNEKIDAYNVARRCNAMSAPFIPHLIISPGAFRGVDDLLRVVSPQCGISNTGNKCYFISCLIGLCGSEGLKRALAAVANPSDANILLRMSFHQLESTQSSYLSLCQEPFSGLIAALGKVFEPLRGGSAPFPPPRQQDVQEVMLPLLELALGKPDLVHFREIVARRPLLSAREASHDSASCSSQIEPRTAPQAASHPQTCREVKVEAPLSAPDEAQSVHQRVVLPEDIFIPSIDSKAITRLDARISTSNIVPISIPNLKTRIFPLEMAFTGVPGVEAVEIQAILRRDENAGKMSPELIQQLLEEGGKRGGVLDPIPVIRRLVLCDEPPPVLPLHIIRFKTAPVRSSSGAVVSFRREKILTSVRLPFHLPVPVLGREDQRYVLRSIILHLGMSDEGGHYVTCIPDVRSERGRDGMPKVWKYYNDGSPVERRSWESLSEVASKNCYLCIYDRLA